MKKVFLIASITLLAVWGFVSFSTDAKLNNSNKTQFNDSDKGFAVVELYTSEGCSSCPSADKLLKQIRDEHKNQKVYVLAYHVDYWNRLGWKDQFSDHRFSERQSQYSRNFNNNSIYTPQAIVNGKEEMIGSAANELKGTIAKYLKKNEPIEFSISLKNVTSGKAELNYTLPKHSINKTLVVNLIENDASTNVKAGENNGRTLIHANVVRSYTKFIIEETTTKIMIDLPTGFNTQNYSIISFIQEKNQGEILGALETRF